MTNSSWIMDMEMDMENGTIGKIGNHTFKMTHLKSTIKNEMENKLSQLYESFEIFEKKSTHH